MSSNFTVTVSGFIGSNAILASQSGRMFTIPTELLPLGLVPGNMVEIGAELGLNLELSRRNRILKVS
jgi:hypothetical protein